MVTRKDQLNAYAFARRRTVAAFLQPALTATEAPPPSALGALLPSVLAGVLLLAAFGAWGIFRPGAPPGWATVGGNVLVGSRSTTRYVVLETDGVRELRPVLNLASARLLLDPARFRVLKVDERVLDGPTLPHGPAIGIPYAPDRLPEPPVAAEPKVWAVCAQPTTAGSGRAARQEVFVLSPRQAGQALTAAGTLSGSAALYVEGPDGRRYLVDAAGTAFPLGGATDAERSLLARLLFGQGVRPRPVGAQWLAVLGRGTPLDIPTVPGAGLTSTAPGLDARSNQVGTVVEAASGTATHKYVVLTDRIAPVSDLTAHLLLNGPQAVGRYPEGRVAAIPVAAASVAPDNAAFDADRGWPASVPTVVNGVAAGLDGTTGQPTVCAVLHQGRTDGPGRPVLGAWAGAGFPVAALAATSSVYVSPGTGLLYRELSGPAGGEPEESYARSGPLYLLTDTGLRYALAGDGSPGDQARTRLGYDRIEPTAVPRPWSDLLPRGPVLDTATARRARQP
ncbi:type VII secretion protein EccB [Kitasatospora sp. NPDC052896]|uniref:type VII secretion protein EccB n=1 Tax=Kitasatospora sp. NPDC052896 TaxID=3364061 RepID=UPI0037C87753